MSEDGVITKISLWKIQFLFVIFAFDIYFSDGVFALVAKKPYASKIKCLGLVRARKFHTRFARCVSIVFAIPARQ